MSCLSQTDNDYYTVVATSRNAKEIGDYFKPAMNNLFATLPGGGKLPLKQLPITDEPDPDFFLWLFYKNHKGIRLAGDVTRTLNVALDLINELERCLPAHPGGCGCGCA